MAPVISRIHLTDDTGSGEDGTIINDALFQTLQDNIDGLSGAIDTAYKAADAGLGAANSTLLLHAAAGQTTVSGIWNLDSVQITGLTALDCLEIFWRLENGSVANANPVRFATDVYIGTLVQSIPAGTVAQGRAVLCQAVAQPKTCSCLSEGMVSAARADNFSFGPISIAWTGTWFLAIQALNLPAGGTLNWAWSVYRRKGQ
jgi:hypothetical protein